MGRRGGPAIAHTRLTDVYVTDAQPAAEIVSIVRHYRYYGCHILRAMTSSTGTCYTYGVSLIGKKGT